MLLRDGEAAARADDARAHDARAQRRDTDCPGPADDAGVRDGVNHAGAAAVTLESRFDPGSNNFDLLRLVLALVVVFCHCFPLRGAGQEPIGAYLHYGFGGTLAVYCFLVISGFLVTRSVCERSLDDYAAARVLRIVPGLALVTLFEVFVVGLAFTNASSWVFLTYVGFRHLWNVTVFGIDAQMYSVFANTTPPWLMNGSIWTIPIECSFYIILPILTLLFGVRASTAAAFLASLAALPVARQLGLAPDAPGPSLFTNVHTLPFLDFSSYFFAGAAAWAWRDRLPISMGLAAISLIALYAAAGVLLSEIVLKLALPYLVLHVSVAGGVGTRLKRRIGDLSYGTYLFGFPVTLSVIALDGTLGVLPTFAAAASLTLLCAWLSWHLVEQPCLRMKSRFGPAWRRPRGSMTEPAPALTVHGHEGRRDGRLS